MKETQVGAYQEKIGLADNLWLTNFKTQFLRNSQSVINQA